MIVGSGPSGIAAACQMLAAGRRVLLLDAGIRPEKLINNTAEVNRYRLGKTTPTKLYFGSDFATRRHPRAFVDFASDIGGGYSNAVGGLSTIWGAALFPFRDEDIRDWSINRSDLANGYKSVLKYLPHSGAANWSIDFPTYGLHPSPSVSDQTISRLIANLPGASINGYKIEALDSLLAVDNVVGSADQCQQCGQCLSGCEPNSIFSSSKLLPRLLNQNLEYISGFFVEQVDETDDCVRIRGWLNNEPSELSCSRLFLGAGPIVSTALALGALHMDSAILDDCQAMTIPLISPTAFGPKISTMSLASAFIEMFDERSGQSEAHFQIYGRGPEFVEAVRASLRIPRRLGPLAGPVVRRSLVAHGFLKPADSRKLIIRRHQVNESRFVVEQLGNPQTALVSRRLAQTLGRFLRPIGLRSAWKLLHLEQPGGSFHTSSSFPIGGRISPFTSDNVGRPVSLRRIHLIDASSLPTMPPQSPTLTVMAHASRIAKAATSMFDLRDFD